MGGMAILKHIHDNKLPCTTVIITAYGNVDVAVDAMRYGAFDFIEKSFNAKRLIVTLRNALDKHILQNEIEQLRQDFRSGYHGFIGASLAMQSVYRIIDSAAPSKATVFITGESGTGKEVCADAIHQQQPGEVPLAIYRLHSPSLIYYARQPLEKVSAPSEVEAHLTQANSLLVTTDIGWSQLTPETQQSLEKVYEHARFPKPGSVMVLKAREAQVARESSAGQGTTR
jgi:CheY-like chemotaxis protein